MKTTTIELVDPRLDHDEARVTSVTLREPRGADYYAHGAPFMRVDRPDGSVIMLENREAIRAYLQVCADERSRPVLDSLSLTDAEALKDALLNFFVEARRARTNSTSAPAPSSSAPV
jgi:hypothetical protein